MMHCWEFEPINRPRFADIVSMLSDSLEAMAGYMEFGAFAGETTVEMRECREALELDSEEQALCQASIASEEKHQDEALISDETAV